MQSLSLTCVILVNKRVKRKVIAKQPEDNSHCLVTRKLLIHIFTRNKNGHQHSTKPIAHITPSKILKKQMKEKDMAHFYVGKREKRGSLLSNTFEEDMSPIPY